MKKLAIVSSHPIQYNAPLFQLLNSRGKLLIHVFYTYSQSGERAVFDPGFKKVIEWDIPLTEGYQYSFVQNDSRTPGTHHFRGIRNPELNQAIRNWEPDALLVYGWAFTSHLSCLREFHGKIPVLFRGDSTILDEVGGFKAMLRKLFLRWVYRHVDFAFFVGAANRAYFIDNGLRPEQLVYAPHAIDNSRFQKSIQDNLQEVSKWRRELGFMDDDLVVMYAGKLEPKKDPMFMTWLALQVKDPRVKFLIVGNGQLETRLKRKTEKDDRFVFLGFQNQRRMPLVYSLADIFILPSRGPGETWGLAINEAMACGLPIIASDKCGSSYDLVNEANGIVFSHDTPGPVVEFIENVLADRALLQSYGAASLKHIQNFTLLKVAEAIEKTVLSLEFDLYTKDIS